jgi:hypothetical protein
VASTRIEFNVDAMLMYGWVSDAGGQLTKISNSLCRWIRARDEAERANELLDRFDADEPATVRELLAALLDSETEAETPELVAQYMKRLAELVADPGSPDGPVPERHGPYRILLQYERPWRGEPPLAGARFVRDAASLMASHRNAERVDVVVVAIAEPHGGGWRIKGFQGQLQEAWLRVSNRIKDGNRAGSIALMARNVSHNIGSHALYWVAAGLPQEQKEFLNYLQVRMELLAGFATSMPLSPVTFKVQDVVSRFRKTKLLLKNISRSERVHDVVIDDQGGDVEAVFFGGEIGLHAFYSILENCIRDSSKFSPRKEDAETLRMNIRVASLEKFIQIDVYDDAGNFAQHGRKIQEALDGIRISDEAGALDPLNWGIKERFVCAALLRGARPEEFPMYELAARRAQALGTCRYDGARILELVEVDQHCAWRFYLPRRCAEILLVTNAAPSEAAPEVIVQSFREFAHKSQSAAGITAPFVVLDGLPEKADPKTLEGHLPHRTYVRGGRRPSRFVSIDMPLGEISPERLLRRSVEELQRGPVRLVLALVDSELRSVPERDDPDLPLLVTKNEDLTVERIGRLHEEHPEERLLIYRRHQMRWPDFTELVGKAADAGVEHFDVYDDSNSVLKGAIQDVANDPVRASLRLIEAALTRILIIDERIDLGLGAEARRRDLSRERLRLRGITVRGAQFAGHAGGTSPVSIEELSSWGRGFHFVLLHRGIADKLCLGAPESEKIREEIVHALEAGGAHLIIHSGRMGMADMPKQTKFISLANVTAWIDQHSSKLQILNELASLRRV